MEANRSAALDGANIKSAVRRRASTGHGKARNLHVEAIFHHERIVDIEDPRLQLPIYRDQRRARPFNRERLRDVHLAVGEQHGPRAARRQVRRKLDRVRPGQNVGRKNRLTERRLAVREIDRVGERRHHDRRLVRRNVRRI